MLRVISSSPNDLAPVFQALLQNATRLRAPQLGNLILYDGDVFRVAGMHNAHPRGKNFAVVIRSSAACSPWQNGYCERLIGSIRRESLDHILVFGKRHLRRLLRAYADYYNRTRTHLSLDKDSLALRAIEPFGRIRTVPILGGLHHRIVRI